LPSISPRRPLRVLEVITRLDVGGAELQLLARVRIEVASGLAVTVCSLTEGGALRKEFVALGVHVIELDSQHLFDPRVLVPLARLLREGSFDVVHAHLFRARLWTIPLARTLRVPLVLQTEHALTQHSFEARNHNVLNRLAGSLLGRLSSSTIAISRDTAETLQTQHHLHPSRITLIPNGIDVSAVETAAQVTPLVDVVALGRLHHLKGFSDLVEAMSILHRRGISATLEIAGAGPTGALLRKKAAELSLTSSVTFVGEIRDPIEFIRRGRIFAMPSLSEGFGIAALEAMAAGVPVVATSVGGLTEIVSHERTGLVVPPRNPSRLADSIERLLDDSSLRRRLAQNASEIVKRFDLQQSTTDLIGIYERALSAKIAS
jgi:glycosyltransferase involved in cell wall biosynthesis